MLVVLTLMAIAAGLAIPAYFGRHSITLDNAALLLLRDLHLAQSYAAFERQPCTVDFFEDGRGWRVVDRWDRVIERPDHQGPFERDFTVDGVFEGVKLEHVDFDGGRELRYDRNGRALPGGTLQIVFDGEVRVLRVTALTGRVIVDGLAEEYLDEK